VQGAVASVRDLMTRKPAGAVWTSWAEALSAKAMSPCRRVSSHWSHQCGTTVTWRRGGSTHFSGQEDVFADSSACLEVVEGTLGGRASLDAIARSVAAGPIEVDIPP
jgi:hypothetical protein